MPVIDTLRTDSIICDGAGGAEHVAQDAAALQWTVNATSWGRIVARTVDAVWIGQTLDRDYSLGIADPVMSIV